MNGRGWRVLMPSPAISSKAERLSISNVRCIRRSAACQYRFGLQKEGGKFAANMSDLNARATYNGIGPDAVCA